MDPAALLERTQPSMLFDKRTQEKEIEGRELGDEISQASKLATSPEQICQRSLLLVTEPTFQAFYPFQHKQDIVGAGGTWEEEEIIWRLGGIHTQRICLGKRWFHPPRG